MKKHIFSILFILCFVSLCTFSVYFAYAENREQIATTNAELTQKTNQVLAILESNSISDKNLEVASLSSASSASAYTILEKTNELSKKDFYNVKSDNYTLNYTSDTLELVNIFNTTNTFGNIGTASKSEAQAFISEIYSELALPTDYELTYLEKVDDSLWEADFSKKYGDIYNKYESVKIFFSPDEKEIAALTIFNEKASETSVYARGITLTENDAKNVVINNLNISDDKITEVYQGFERANGYYSNEELDLSKNIYNVWIVKYLDSDSIVNSCYIDINSGEIIGGAIQK